MGGFNNNPNCLQFALAYKRLLHHNEIKSSAQVNCISIDTTHILTVSSASKISSGLNEFDKDSCEPDDIFDKVIDDVPLEFIHSGFNLAILYIAGFVELKLLKKLKCATCLQLFNECKEV